MDCIEEKVPRPRDRIKINYPTYLPKQYHKCDFPEFILRNNPKRCRDSPIESDDVSISMQTPVHVFLKMYNLYY